MPPRDEQEYEQRRQQILDGALEAFSAKGFDGASNKDIAQAAQIASPGLIYHYFKDKIDLLHRVVEERMPVLRLLNEAEQLQDQPPEEVLPEMALRILRAYEQGPAPALMRLVLGEAMRNPRLAKLVVDTGPGRGLRIMARYLERQMDLGRLRRMDPRIATFAFVGPLLGYTLVRNILREGSSDGINQETMAHEAAALFLRGMAPE
jgi:TetR/AcrR family transcriptional regulator, mexJK operon transcriptional repressor